jgi:hypothetical protein
VPGRAARAGVVTGEVAVNLGAVGEGIVAGGCGEYCVPGAGGGRAGDCAGGWGDPAAGRRRGRVRPCRVAFRADQAGITLPAMPHATLLLWAFKCHCKSGFIPWSQVKGITLCTIRGTGRARLKAPVIEIHHSYSRDAHGSYALRSIITWRLDRNRLAAVVTAAAPGIPTVERGRI